MYWSIYQRLAKRAADKEIQVQAQIKHPVLYMRSQSERHGGCSSAPVKCSFSDVNVGCAVMKDRPTLAEEPVAKRLLFSRKLLQLAAVSVTRDSMSWKRKRTRQSEGFTGSTTSVWLYFFIFHLVQLLSSLKPQTTKRLLRSSVTPNSRYLTNVQLFNECFQYLTTVQPSIECSVSCRGDSQNFLTAFLCFQRGNPCPDWSFKQCVMVEWRRELGQKFYWDGGGCMILFLFVCAQEERVCMCVCVLIAYPCSAPL